MQILQAGGGGGGGEEPFDVVDDVEGTEEGGQREGGVFAMGHGEDHGVVAVGVGGWLGKGVDDVDAVFTGGNGGGGPGVVDVDGEVEIGRAHV